MPAEKIARMFAALMLAALTATTQATGLQNVHFHQPPPNFGVPARYGTKLLSDWRGKPVVLNFWASWCRPCTNELHDFVRAERTYGTRIHLLTISSEPHDVAASYLRLWNIELPLLEDFDGSISHAYSVPPIPVTVVLDRNGDVTYVSVGGLNWRQLNRAIQADLTPNVLGTPTPRVLR